MKAFSKSRCRTSTVFVCNVIACCCSIAYGDSFSLESVSVPAPSDIRFLYTFYVFDREDAPAKTEGDLDFPPPYVEFRDVVLKMSSSVAPTDVASVQLTLTKYSRVRSLIDQAHKCCTSEDVKAGRCLRPNQLLVRKQAFAGYRDVGVYNYTVDIEKKLETKRSHFRLLPLPPSDESITGAYVLAISSCGNVDPAAAVLTGQVIIKNAFGFLPGDEYQKLPFYGWMSTIYMLLAFAWMLLSLRWWRELVAIQHCITVVLFLSLMECFTWWVMFDDWNTSGVRSDFTFILAIFSSVVKHIFSYMLVLVASLGWGVTRPHLDPGVMVRIQVITWLYVALDVIKELVLAFQRATASPEPFIALCLLPVSILNGVIFYWVFAALAGLIESLQDRRQNEKLVVFQTLWRILVCVLAIATVTLLYHSYTISKLQEGDQWRSEWLFSVGIPHLLFFSVLVAMMYLWAPHKYSQRYAYSASEAQASDERSLKDAVTWVDEEDDDDDDSFWKTTKAAEDASRKAPKQVGAPDPTTVGASSGVFVDPADAPVVEKTS